MGQGQVQSLGNRILCQRWTFQIQKVKISVFKKRVDIAFGSVTSGDINTHFLSCLLVPIPDSIYLSLGYSEGYFECYFTLDDTA